MFISRFLHMKAEEERREIARAEAEERREIARAEAREKARAISRIEERARETGLAAGIEIGKTLGKATVQETWLGWLRRMREAERDGKPFNEPPPDF